MALPTSRRRRLEVEALEPRHAPSSVLAPALGSIHGTIHLTPTASALQPHSGGIMVYTGIATLNSARTGILKGTFTETIRPYHAHGHTELTVSGHGDTFALRLLEGFKPATGATQADLGVKVTGRVTESHVPGEVTGYTNFSTGAANLTFSISLIRL